MDHAPTAVPRAAGRSVSARAPARHSLARWALWAAVLAGGSLLSRAQAGGVEPYLPRRGPTVLRFAAAPAKDFVWPPLVPESTQPTNCPLAVAAMPTNAAIFSEPFWAVPTNDVVFQAGGEAPAPPKPEPVTDLDGNPLSASNLLVVTPQMLSEYLRPPPGATNAPSTNAVPNGALWFAPPAPKGARVP